VNHQCDPPWVISGEQRWVNFGKRLSAVLDLDAAVRDPQNPERLLDGCDTGDHLHLSPEGYQRLADAVDLTLLCGD